MFRAIRSPNGGAADRTISTGDQKARSLVVELRILPLCHLLTCITIRSVVLVLVTITVTITVMNV